MGRVARVFWPCVPTYGGLPYSFSLSTIVVVPLVLKHFNSPRVLDK
jgi:hypothetical protein